MNSEQAKLILAAYRPETDAVDLQVAEALDQCQRDPDLRGWLDTQLDFHRGMRDRFRQIPVPSDLPGQLLSEREVIAPVWRLHQPALWAAAAMLLVMVALAAFWLRPAPPDSFAVFRARMVRTALREYRMDVVTNDMPQIREFLRANRAPADYQLPDSLVRLPAMGAGLLSWQGERVSMVCFEGSPQTVFFLFIVDKGAVRRPPSSRPEFGMINDLATASWTANETSYLLAAPVSAENLRGYF